MRRGDRVVGRDDQLGCLVLNGETLGDVVVQGLHFEFLPDVRKHDDPLVRSETGHQESVVALLLLLHVHEVPGFDVLEGLGNDRLAVTSCLPIRGAVIKDDRPSVLRWIEVVEQVSVGAHEGNEHPEIDHPTT